MNKLIRRYVIWTYLIFFISIMIIGLVLTATKSQALVKILQTIAAWIPTFIFVAMFRKIYPEDNLKAYVKRMFSRRIKASTLVCIFLVFLSVFLGSLYLRSSVEKVPIGTLLNASWISLMVLFGTNLISGPMGEEIGWRGFLLNEFQKKHSPLKSAIIVGVIWSFWHTFLWLVSGYAGLELLQYIASFLITGVSVSIITTAFYNMNRNIAIPMLTHQLLNYLLGIQTGDVLNILTASSTFYFIAAAVLIAVNHKNCLYGIRQGKLQIQQEAVTADVD